MKLYSLDVVKSVDVLNRQYVRGQSPLILPLPNPRLAVTANLSVFDHIISARGQYSLPPTHQELINAIRYADYIADTRFISCISNLLQLPRTKMTYSIPFDEFRKSLRNRYRQVVNGKTLRRPPLENECVKCGLPVEVSDDTFLSCCFRRIHMQCGVDDHQCPYCGTSWELLNCFVCSKPICLATRNRHISFRKYGGWTTCCCGSQFHPDCTKGAARSPCRICGTAVSNMGIPLDEYNVHADTDPLLLRHNMKRRHDFLRRTFRSQYDNMDYLISIARPYTPV